MDKPNPSTHVDPPWTNHGLDPAVLDILAARLQGNELSSLLLSVARQRAAARRPRDVQRQFEQDRFVALAPVDQRTLRRLELDLLETARDFQAIELAPTAPLGTCLVVAPGSQNRIVSTMRGSEVVSDPTNVMAMECARRLRADPGATVRLTTVHRCVRAQAVLDQKGFAAHFSMFCLATAARGSANQAFTVRALADHVLVHLSGLHRLEQNVYDFGQRTIRLQSTPQCRPLALLVGAEIHMHHPAAVIEHQPLESSYYRGLRFTIDVVRAQAQASTLIDGGVFDWVGQLAANRKLRFVASAMGTQVAVARFKK